jgi:acetyl-CoA acetyltransferase
MRVVQPGEGSHVSKADRRRVAVVGVALSDIGRVDDKTELQLHQQAISRAVADAGMSKGDVDGLCSTGTGILSPIEVAEYVGLAPQLAHVESTTVGGSTWQFMARHAATAISAGLVDVVVLSYASTSRADLKRGLRTSNLNFGYRDALQFDAPYGHTLVSKYAMSARRHMAKYGTSIEQLAEIAVATRANAALNPDAYYRSPISVDDVLASRPIAEPLTKLQCCIRSDGGAAVVLAAEDRARDAQAAPVWILGAGEAVSHVTFSEWDDFTASPCVRAGRSAFREAGVAPSDIDICQLYDSFTITVLLTLEGLGFCGVGEGGPFVEGGRLRVDGDLPTNTDGGGLSACHPGMRGLFLVVEAARQLRKEAGARQVPDARLACVSGTGGWFSSAATMILGVD